jgi:hypothetical protein
MTKPEGTGLYATMVGARLGTILALFGIDSGFGI